MSSRPWQQKVGKFRALSTADKWMLLHATVWLAVARIMLIVLPFRRLATWLSTKQRSDTGDPNPELLKKIGYAVRAAASNVPWRSDCFPQSIAGWMLIKHHGCNATIHLGVERVGEESLAGHAWLTCGDTVVIGGEESDRYTEMLPL